MKVVEAVCLKRSFNGFFAVKGTDFSIRQGECYGFLGPNGAGKTTTVSMIQGFFPPTDGTLTVLGFDMTKEPSTAKASIGVVPQENSLDRDLTVLQNLVTFARYFSIPKHEAIERGTALLDFLHLSEKKSEKITTLSGGMQRRLAIARALINKPRLLILDEPTTGLDPQARRLIWERIQQLKREGITVILTTHYMEEAERLCDRLAIMDDGRILLEGPPKYLVAQEIGRWAIEVVMADEPMALLSARLDEQKIQHQQHGDALYFYPGDAEAGIKLATGFPHTSILQRHAGLEDLFLRLAGRSLNG